ncbi:MAG: NUDIX hydrolase [Pseudolabrys sp.]|nr:NUDIX hydrolase [Pseudolabrys sp.]
MGEYPKIQSRRTIEVSPWMKVVEREVAYKNGTTELYHAVGQPDYIAIVALTPDGRIPIVRQYRPAMERFTWELPAGMVDEGEDPAATCERELLEETGYPSKAVHALGINAPCTARLSNKVHSFFVEAGPRPAGQTIEAGIELNLVSPDELSAMIFSSEFPLQLHIGALMLAGMRGFLDLSSFTPR